MSYAVDLLAKIDDLAKRHKLSAEEKFALNLEASAICFLLEATDDDHRRFEEFANAPPPGAAHAVAFSKGAFADLRSRGIDASNAKEYFNVKLAALDEKLRSRA